MYIDIETYKHINEGKAIYMRKKIRNEMELTVD